MFCDIHTWWNKFKNTKKYSDEKKNKSPFKHDDDDDTEENEKEYIERYVTHLKRKKIIN